MLLVFIDETSDSKFKEYLGFSIATVNARFYPKIKTKALEILLDIGWDPDVEFKGSYLFSKTSGCTDIEIEKRINAAHSLLDLNVANENSRMRFYFGDMRSENHRQSYLTALPELLHKVLPRPPKGAGKNLLVLSCDHRDDITQDELHNNMLPAIDGRGYVLYERVISSDSSFENIGLMFADLVGYLVGRIDTISNDSELFEGLTPEQFERNGKIRKLKSSQELIGKIKQLSVLSHGSVIEESS